MLRLYDTLGGRPDPDEELIRAIGSVRLRWRLKVAMRGLAIVVAAGLAVFLVSTYGMDKLRFTPTSVTVFRVLTYVAVLVLLIRFLVLPLLRSVSDRRVALYIEEREPSLQASLISAVEYREQGKDAGAANLSPALAGKLVQSAADRCRDIKFGHNIEQRALRRSSGALAGVAMAGLLLIVTSPGFMRTGAPFLLFPWSDKAAENPYAIEVLPGDTLLPRGADLRVNAQLLGFDAEDVTIAVKRGDAEWERWSMTVGRDPGAYEIFLFDLEDAAEYAIEASGVRSPVYSIEVADLPYVAQLDLEYRFPAYTGMSPLIQEDRGDIAALVGTNVVLTVTPTMTVTRGMIVIDGGDSIAMDVGGDGRLTGTLTVRSAGLYRIALDAFDGRMVVGSPDYVIDALTDQPPTIRFEKPGRDIKVTPVEEAFLEVKAEDDYGLRSVQLMYSVNGGPEDTLDLYTGMRRTTQMSAGHTFYLEEMNLEPGDLVSYYAQVADNDRVGGRQTTTSDIYFMEVRPFRRDYRQAEQGGGGGGGGGDGLDGQFSEQQRQIVAATFKMVRDRDQYADVEYRENMATLALSQGRLRERVEAVVRRIQDRGVMRSDSGFIKIMQELPAAAAEMLTSEEELGERDAREALPAAQRALQHLQRAEAAFRDVQVSMGQQGGGGGGQNQSNAEDLADLFELELDKMQNQYESVQRGEQRQVDREIDATMQRLEELARRQQQENERMRRRASSMQGQAGGGGGNQRQLAEQAEELARQLERLGREQSLDNLQDTARRLREAANAMRRAADSRRGSDLAEAQSALDRLQEARRLLERGRSERLNRDVQDALRRAERLVEQQDQMTEDVERLGAGGGRPSPEAMSRIMERKDELQREVSELETDLDRMAREWRDEQRDAARGLAGAAQSIRDNRLADKIRYSKGVVQQRTPEYARNFEEQIAADIEELRQRIEGAAGEIGENEGQRVGELLEDTRDLMQDLESLDERIQSQAERLQRGDDQGQQGSQQQGGQQQGGQQQGGQQQGGREGRQAGQPGDRGGNPAGQTRGGFGGFDPGQVRQYRREFRERLGDLEELRQGLAREGIDVDPLDDVMALLRQLDSRGIFDDPAEIARLQRDVIEGLKEFEYALRRAFQSDDADRLLLSGSDEVPEGFRELVEEYYRSLSNRNR